MKSKIPMFAAMAAMFAGYVCGLTEDLCRGIVVAVRDGSICLFPESLPIIRSIEEIREKQRYFDVAITKYQAPIRFGTEVANDESLGDQ
jgi:hypothetical protein